jgi:hypothetical protein
MLRVLVALYALCLVSVPAKSEVYTFKVRSLHPNAVQIKFYSQARKGHQWPTSKTAWDLKDDETHALSMTCNRNEKICWGAWVKGGGRPEWGAGVGGTDGCKNCCFTCKNAESDGILTLNVRIDGDRAVAIQKIDMTKPSRPPKAVKLDDN